ncbi:MAG: SufBD protein [Oscillospiraceae bacterium]
MEISDNISLLTSKNASEGCAAFNRLLTESGSGPEVYEYMEHLLSLTEDKNSFVRTRALLLIIANAKWDKQELIDASREKLLSHMTDGKPITARQFIQNLPDLAAQKPGLRDEIAQRLRSADFSGYKDSMRPLLEKDREKALEKI